MELFDAKLFRRITQYAKPYRFRFNAVIVWAILLSVFAALRPYLLKNTVDDYIQNKDNYGLLLYISLMAGLLILEVLSQYFFVYWANWLGQDIIKDIRKKLFAHILSFKLKYFDSSPVGKMVTRTVSDTESIASIFSQGLFMIVSDVLKMLVILIIMFYMNWKLSIIVMLAMPILVYATSVFQLKMKQAFEEVRTHIAAINTFIQENVTGMKIVQLFSREDIEFEKFKQINKQHQDAWIKTVWYNSIFFPIADIISSLTLGSIVWYGGLTIVNGENLTSFGDLFAYIMMINMLFNPLRQIADKFNVLQMGMIAAKRVFEILDSDKNIEDSGKITDIHFKGDIRFENVSFGYVDDEMVLKNLNLDVKSGETIAIVGSTGAGKSTIINLLSRFYDINAGDIYIDNTNIKNIQLQTLRSQIGVVLQDVFLFSDTIFNNITLKNTDITENEVIEAAKKIGVHDFIESLPGGYQYNVKERGIMLSSGQRQLIAFLRAYITNPSILVLDEATSSIDSYSEELIQKATEKITEGRTSIVIAHRLATVVNADKIIVLDKGIIVEQGSHEVLLSQNGMYKMLYDSQFQTFKEA